MIETIAAILLVLSLSLPLAVIYWIAEDEAKRFIFHGNAEKRVSAHKEPVKSFCGIIRTSDIIPDLSDVLARYGCEKVEVEIPLPWAEQARAVLRSKGYNIVSQLDDIALDGQPKSFIVARGNLFKRIHYRIKRYRKVAAVEDDAPIEALRESRKNRIEVFANADGHVVSNLPHPIFGKHILNDVKTDKKGNEDTEERHDSRGVIDLEEKGIECGDSGHNKADESQIH